jgi:hypothetical protein
MAPNESAKFNRALAQVVRIIDCVANLRNSSNNKFLIK